MMIGVVTAKRQAVLRIEIIGPHGQSGDVEATIDTGFTGYLTLPATDIAALGLQIRGTRPATLADGSRVMMDVYRATIVWDGQRRDIQVLAAESGPLIGMAMLYGHDVNIRVVDGGDVIIKRLP